MMTKVKGIDVSHWQGTIQWKKIAKDGVDFVMLKATESDNYTDPTFYNHAINAKKAGLLVGAYHFARFSSVEKAIKEADYFIKVIKASSIDFEMPLVLDLESNDSKLSKKDLTECMNVFIERVRKGTGKAVMLYSFKTFLENNLIKPQDIPFWYARYGVEQPDIECDMWQYTDKGKVDGIAGTVDLNWFYKDITTVKIATIDKEIVKENKPQKGDGDLYTPSNQALKDATRTVITRLTNKDPKGIDKSWIKKLDDGELTNSDAISLIYVALERGLIQGK
jgi:lysozyme